MNRRLLPILVALVALGAPASAAAQESGYDPTIPTTSTETPSTTTTTPEPEPEPDPEPTPTDDSEAAPQEDAGGEPQVAPATAAANQSGAAPSTATGTTPSQLAYTGSEVWLVGLIGLLALAGGAALMRSSRST